jgi:hypothetical protein
MVERLWFTRRSLTFAVIGVVLVLSAATLARPAAGQEHDGPLPNPAPGILPPGHWTPEQVDFAIALVRRNEQELPEKFGDVSKLPALGYTNFGLTAPGGYDHWGLPYKPGDPDDGHVFDPKYPESVVFQHMPDGSQRLVAAMYMVLTMADIPPDYAWLPGWHTHTGQFCIDDNGRAVGSPVNGVCATGHELTAPMTHVWIVDPPGCGHRFAGIGIGGVECYLEGEHPDHSPGGTILFPPPGGSAGSVPRPVPSAPTTSAPGGDHGPDASTVPAPAPVSATPTYTG